MQVEVHMAFCFDVCFNHRASAGLASRSTGREWGCRRRRQLVEGFSKNSQKVHPKLLASIGDPWHDPACSCEGTQLGRDCQERAKGKVGGAPVAASGGLGAGAFGPETQAA